jgi:hypothetical protein
MTQQTMVSKMNKGLFILAVLLLPGAALADGPVTPAGTSSSVAANVQGVTGGVPMPVSGTFSASLGGFQPAGTASTPLAVTATTGNVALPSGAPTVVAVYNVGAKTAYVKLGTTSGVTAAVSNDAIAAGGSACYTVGSNTYLAAITGGSDTTTLNITGGTGLCSGFGGGGGGATVTRTIVALDVSSVTTGGTAVTALATGHATAGGYLVTANAAGICVDQVTTAGTVTGTPSTTACVAQNQPFYLVPANHAVSVNSSASTVSFGGEGLQ